MFIVFLCKLLDCTFGTVKQICMSKGGYFKAAIMNSISSFFYFFMLQIMSKDNSLKSIIVATIGVFLGTYIPGIISQKLQKDSVYVFNITSYNKSLTERFIKEIIILKMGHVLIDGHDFDYIKVFAENKDESKIVQNLLHKEHSSELKHHVIPTRTYTYST